MISRAVLLMVDRVGCYISSVGTYDTQTYLRSLLGGMQSGAVLWKIVIVSLGQLRK
jgi:hypothetical protein